MLFHNTELFHTERSGKPLSYPKQHFPALILYSALCAVSQHKDSPCTEQLSGSGSWMAGDHNQIFDTDFMKTQSRTVQWKVDAELCLIVFGTGSNAAQLDNVVTFLGRKKIESCFLGALTFVSSETGERN